MTAPSVEGRVITRLRADVAHYRAEGLKVARRALQLDREHKRAARRTRWLAAALAAGWGLTVAAGLALHMAPR